jgi:hypothetical protein
MRNTCSECTNHDAQARHSLTELSFNLLELISCFKFKSFNVIGAKLINSLIFSHPYVSRYLEVTAEYCISKAH